MEEGLPNVVDGDDGVQAKSPQGDDSSQNETTSKRGHPAKNWVFSWFYEDQQPKVAWPGTQFLAYQPEVCPKTGRKHLQGYVQFKDKRRLSALKKLQNEVHWEVRKGTHKQALAYVRKEDTRMDGALPVQEGEPVEQGGVGQLQADLAAGMSRQEVIDEHFGLYLRYPRAIDTIISMNDKPRDGNTPVFTTVLWGPPGTGKTHKAQEMGGPDAYWLSQPNNKAGALWWDGYTGQTTVIIDEFTGWIPREVMCRILDKYPFLIQKKGMFVQLRATRFIICSNKRPEEWWPKSYAKDHLGPIERRISAPLGEVQYMCQVYRLAQSAGPESPPASPVFNPPPPHLLDDGMNGFSQFLSQEMKKVYECDGGVQSDEDIC